MSHSNQVYPYYEVEITIHGGKCQWLVKDYDELNDARDVFVAAISCKNEYMSVVVRERLDPYGSILIATYAHDGRESVQNWRKQSGKPISLYKGVDPGKPLGIETRSQFRARVRRYAISGEAVPLTPWDFQPAGV